MADSSQTTAPTFVGSVQIGALGRYLVLVAVLGTETLVGRAVTDGFTVVLDHGHQVIIES